MGADGVADNTKYLIPGGVPGGLVVGLEVGDVHHDQREVVAVSLGALDLLGQTLVEVRVSVEAGDAVRDLPQLRLRPEPYVLQAHGDMAAYRLQERDVRLLERGSLREGDHC